MAGGRAGRRVARRPGAPFYFFAPLPPPAAGRPSSGEVSRWLGYSMYVFAVTIILMAGVGSMQRGLRGPRSQRRSSANS